MPSTDPLARYVRTRADKLEHFSDRITRCHVTIETPHRHHLHGRHHQVRIDVGVPGSALVVTRHPDARKDYEDLYASIDAAFDDAQRLLVEHVRRRRDH
jgi:ribosomal subunit interface protein